MIDMVHNIEELYFTAKRDVLGEEIEEAMIEEYQAIKGASLVEIQDFEEKFQIILPKDFKKLYQYKNGSGWIELISPQPEAPFRLLSLQEMAEVKRKFQSQNCRMREFPEIIPAEKIKDQLDRRIRRYLYHKSWFPFATMGNSLYLMLDYCPTKKGVEGQIICYIYDPDFITYTARHVTELLRISFENIKQCLEG